MEQQGAERVHLAQDARPPGFASDRQNAFPALNSGSQLGAKRADDKLGRFAFVVTELGLGIPNALHLIVILVLEVYHDHDVSYKAVSTTIVLQADDLLQDLCAPSVRWFSWIDGDHEEEV
jgi:hypothetical protein